MHCVEHMYRQNRKLNGCEIPDDVLDGIDGITFRDRTAKSVEHRGAQCDGSEQSAVCI